MQIFVKLPNGKTITIEIKNTDDLNEVKKKKKKKKKKHYEKKK